METKIQTLRNNLVEIKSKLQPEMIGPHLNYTLSSKTRRDCIDLVNDGIRKIDSIHVLVDKMKTCITCKHSAYHNDDCFDEKRFIVCENFSKWEAE